MGLGARTGSGWGPGGGGGASGDTRNVSSEGSQVVGLVATLMGTVTSGLAGVYLEKVPAPPPPRPAAAALGLSWVWRGW